jgi:HEPN domain-containing protein
MKNTTLAADYLKRCQNRLKAIEVLYQNKSWADVVRESQEVVELGLKALLRMANIEVPRIHDVGDILLKEKNKFPKKTQTHLKKMSKISHDLRRDRELAFYGSEDLTPGEFYKKEDAKHAQESATWVIETILKST